MKTWRELITWAMEDAGETWIDVVSTAPDGESWLDVEFDAGYGCVDGVPFTVWTGRNVYFPREYDGAESVGFVSRTPDGRPTDHQ